MSVLWKFSPFLCAEWDNRESSSDWNSFSFWNIIIYFEVEEEELYFSKKLVLQSYSDVACADLDSEMFPVSKLLVGLCVMV